MESGRKQKIFGLLMALFSAGFILWSWYTAIVRGYFYIKAGVIFPAFLVIGMALIFIPGYREERLASGEDISNLHGYKLITKRWWAVLIVGSGLGLANYIALRFLL
jgi:hypothetical protein